MSQAYNLIHFLSIILLLLRLTCWQQLAFFLKNRFPLGMK